MNLSQIFLASVMLLTAEPEVNRYHINYLIQHKKIAEAINLYEKYRLDLGRHDFEILQQLGMTLLEEGARSDDPEKQLLSIFGSSIAGISSSLDILSAGISSPRPETQIAAIHALARLQDDRSDDLLNRAMSSEYLPVRMEAAYFLAARKARTAVGQIEALMHRLPPQMRFFFPEFFALIGTNEAILVLRGLIDDPQMHVKVEAILSTAQYQRDDLLPTIRALLTHSHPQQQEACCFAIGKLKDSKSLARLKQLSTSSFPHIQIAALYALYQLGDQTAQKSIEKIASLENLFAINQLGDMPGSEETLIKLLEASSEQVVLNAAVSLLRLHDPRCKDFVLSLLLRDKRDLGFEPHRSVGNSLMSWKLVPLAKQKAVEKMYDLHALSLSIREHFLVDCLELPEQDFLKIAKIIFQSRQIELIPQLITLLENLGTNDAISLLQAQTNAAGAPLIRTYCSLALYRMNKTGPYEELLKTWIRSSQNKELIRFRPIMIRQKHLEGSHYELTPEENSRLLIEAYSALAEKHEKESIDLLLEGIKSGHQKNRYVLAGLLLHSIQ
ncbi:MAG: HEAT repeat domain-containing protein [Chlamydiota bacterium]